MLCKSPALTAIPVDLPSDAVKFRLERTSVSRIFRGAFSAMPELLYLWLTYNSITVLHPRSFTNRLSFMSYDWMGTSCPPSPGRDSGMCPASERSDCTITALARIPPLAARCLANVTYLDLSSNRLSTLPNDLTALWPFSDSTQTQRSVVLGENPHCRSLSGCRMITIRRLKKANVTDSTHSIWYWQQYEEVEIYSGVQMFISSKIRFFF